jgi:hypothetical protein
VKNPFLLQTKQQVGRDVSLQKKSCSHLGVLIRQDAFQLSLVGSATNAQQHQHRNKKEIGVAPTDDKATPTRTHTPCFLA